MTQNSWFVKSYSSGYPALVSQPWSFVVSAHNARRPGHKKHLLPIENNWKKEAFHLGKKRTLSDWGRKHFERAEDLLVWPAVCSRWWPELQPSVFGWSRRGWLLSSGIYDGHSCYTLHRKHSSTAVYHVIRTWSLRAQFCIYNVTDCTSIYFLT